MTSQAQADAAAVQARAKTDMSGAGSGEAGATAADGAAAGPSAATVPSWTLTEPQLADLELLLSGAFAPLAGFMTAADVTSVAESWQLADGTPFPIPVTLDVPAEAVPADAPRLALADPEGTPLAILQITERTIVPARPGEASGSDGERSDDGRGPVRLAGPVTANRVPEYGPFRRLMRTPEEARAQAPEGPLLAWAGRGPLHRRQIGQLRHLAGQLKARISCSPWWRDPPRSSPGPSPWSGRRSPRRPACPAIPASSRCRWLRGRPRAGPRARFATWPSGPASPPRTVPPT